MTANSSTCKLYNWINCLETIYACSLAYKKNKELKKGLVLLTVQLICQGNWDYNRLIDWSL